MRFHQYDVICLRVSDIAIVIHLTRPDQLFQYIYLRSRILS